MNDQDDNSENGKNTKSKKKPSMNMHGVFLHVLADALGSVVVIISALIIKFVPHDPRRPQNTGQSTLIPLCRSLLLLS